MVLRTKQVLMTVLATVLTLMLLVTTGGPAGTIVFAETEALTKTERDVYDQLDEWEDRLKVFEYGANDLIMLQIYLVVSSLDDPDMDMDSFSDAFMDMVNKEDFAYDRVYLDMLNQAGERLESYDFNASSIEDYDTATFSRAASGEKVQDQSVDKSVIEINEGFSIDDNDFLLTSYTLMQEEDGPCIVFTFDYTNNTGETASAYWVGEYYGMQDGVILDQVSSLDDYDTMYRDIPSNSTVKDCLVGFYIDNARDPVSLTIESFLGAGKETYTFDIEELAQSLGITDQPLEENTVEINEQLVIGDNAFTFTTHTIVQDKEGPYVLLTFDYTNNTGQTDSAAWVMDYFGVQNGISLKEVAYLDDYETTYKDIPSGSTVKDCILGFYLENMTDPVTIILEDYMDDRSETFMVNIDSGN